MWCAIGSYIVLGIAIPAAVLMRELESANARIFLSETER